MKGAISSILLLAGAVSAIAVADPVAEAQPLKTLKPKFGFCGVKGSSCKREAVPNPVAEAEPLKTLKPKFGFCGVKGSSCKRSAEANPVAEAEPRKTLRPKFGLCGVKGSSCKRDAMPNAVAEAEPRKTLRPKFGFCGVKGSSCKRDAMPNAVAEAEPAKTLTPKFGFCGVKGSSCHRMKRSAEAIAEAFAEAAPSPLGAPAPLKTLKPKFGFCGVKGSSCHKARRSLQDVGEILERSVGELEAREAEADPKKKLRVLRPKFGFCGVKGSSCKMAKREALPEGDEAEDDAVEAYDAIIAARDAFKQIKRDTEETEIEDDTYDDELNEIEAALDAAIEDDVVVEDE